MLSIPIRFLFLTENPPRSLFSALFAAGVDPASCDSTSCAFAAAAVIAPADIGGRS